jgi:hypothetical protein
MEEMYASGVKPDDNEFCAALSPPTDQVQVTDADRTTGAGRFQDR